MRFLHVLQYHAFTSLNWLSQLPWLVEHPGLSCSCNALDETILLAKTLQAFQPVHQDHLGDYKRHQSLLSNALTLHCCLCKRSYGSSRQ